MHRPRMSLPLAATICLLILVGGPPVSTQAQIPPVASESEGCWSVVPAPRNNSAETGLTKLSLTPAGELWAAGMPPSAANPQQNQPSILRWNGNTWDAMPTPQLPFTGTYTLTSLKAFSPVDVWILGIFTLNGQAMPATAHWEGKQWRQVPLSTTGFGNTYFSDIDGTSSANLWVVGTSYSGPHNADATGVTLKWDGKQWKDYSTPELDHAVSLNRVVVVSEHDAWAIGPHILHWDGSRWEATQADCPDCQGMSLLSPNDIWAVGGGAAAAHSDGKSWTAISGPPTLASAQLRGVAGLGPNNVWAVGKNGDDALFMHWDGNSWTAIPNQAPGFRSELNDIVALGGELWAAGNRTLKSSGASEALLMRYTSSPCPSGAPQKPLNPPVPLPGTGSQLYVTGKGTSGIFLKYWQEHGGLQQQGYPISNVMGEMSDLNGTIYTVQYFERAAFEYHPENKGTPYEVLLAQLGTFQYKKKYPNGAPNQRPNRDPGTVHFPQTGKRVGGAFYAYWKEHGGLQQQGYPISDEFTEVSDLDGKPYTVQYFERALFEWHSENKPPYSVLLSQLGRFRYDDKYDKRQGQSNEPRRIAGSILASTLHGAGSRLVWYDLRGPSYNTESIYSYDAAQNRELPISPFLVAPNGLPLATNGEIALWSRRDIDTRYLEGYSFKSNSALRVDQPPTVSSPDFRRSDIALDGDTLYYTDNWTGHTGVFAYDLATSSERQIYDKVPSGLAAGGGALLWTETARNGPVIETSLKMYRASSGSVSTLGSGIGAFTGYGASGDYVVYSFYNSIVDQTTYLQNIKTGARKVIVLGAASNPVIVGNRVAWVRWPSAESGESDGWKIETYTISKGAASTLVAGLRAMPKNLVLLDNDKLAFAADFDLSTAGSELYLVDLDGIP